MITKKIILSISLTVLLVPLNVVGNMPPDLKRPHKPGTLVNAALQVAVDNGLEGVHQILWHHLPVVGAIVEKASAGLQATAATL